MLKDMVIQSCTHYLEDSEVPGGIGGYKIWGSPWTPAFCDWGFNLERGEHIKAKWDMIPDNTDILITHGPPLGIGDKCSNGEQAGCSDLLDSIRKRIRPLYNIYGHIHEGYGIRSDGITTYINASSVNCDYKAVNPAVVFDLPIKAGATGETEVLTEFLNAFDEDDELCGAAAETRGTENSDAAGADGEAQHCSMTAYEKQAQEYIAKRKEEEKG